MPPPARTHSASDGDALGGQRGDVREHDDVEVAEIDRGSRRRPWPSRCFGSMPASSSAVIVRTVGAAVLAIAGAQRGLDVEQLVVVADRARIAVDEQHADLVAQRRRGPSGGRRSGARRRRARPRRRSRACRRAASRGTASSSSRAGADLERAARDDAVGDRERELDALPASSPKLPTSASNATPRLPAPGSGSTLERGDREVRQLRPARRSSAHERRAVLAPRRLVAVRSPVFATERDQEHGLARVARRRRAAARRGSARASCRRAARSARAPSS